MSAAPAAVGPDAPDPGEPGGSLPARVTRWLVGRLASRRAGWIAALIGVGLCLPALGNGLVLDDHMHRLMANGGGGVPTLARGPFEMYSFLIDDSAWRADADARGLLPWYAAEHLHARFWRPLPSATLWVEYRHGAPRVLSHAHDLLWYGLAIWAMWLTYAALFERHHRRPAGGPSALGVAGLATLLFAIDDAHGLPVGWSANRHAAMATCFAALAFHSHVLWRTGGGTRFALSSVLWLGVGLLCGELTLSISAYLFAYALFLDTGRAGSRALSLAPAFVVCVCWLLAYRHFGYGAGDSGLYTDPLSEPWSFVAALPGRVLALLAGQWTPLSSEAAFLLAPSATVPVLVVSAAMLAAIAAAVARRVRSGGLYATFALGMVIAVLPACAVFASDRNLFLVGLGGFGLLAVWLADAAHGPRPGRFERVVLSALLVVHFALAPVSMPLRSVSSLLFASLMDAQARSLDSVWNADSDGTLVIVTTSDFFSGPVAIGASRRSQGLPVPDAMRVLHTGFVPVTVTRTGTRTLALSAESFAAAPLDLLLRPLRGRWSAGQVVARAGWEYRVEATDGRGLVTALEVRAPVPLDSPTLTWTWLSADGYAPFALPAVGEAVELRPMDRSGTLKYSLAHWEWPR